MCGQAAAWNGAEKLLDDAQVGFAISGKMASVDDCL
jgi:hypothetical protein